MKGNSTWRRRATQLIVGVALIIATSARADETINVFARIDNDLFTGTDREYTSGVEAGFTTATVDSFDHAGFAPSLRRANRALRWLQPKGFDENNVTWTIGQLMFTPADGHLEDPDRRDRPYAGLLLAGITYNSRDSHSLRSTSLDVGIVGPSAFARQTQNLVHRVVGADRFLGWDHQLNDEPVFRVLHERFRRWDIRPTRRVSDVTVHYGGSIGNLSTFANAGAELRIGRHLPDNFGTATTLSYGQNTAPTRWGSNRQSIHGFVAIDTLAVLHDITLDGNTWRHSASVDRERYVAEVALGVALYWRGWQTTVGVTYRTKEFETQTGDTRFGTLTFRRAVARA